jgi:hypothetical protein
MRNNFGVTENKSKDNDPKAGEKVASEEALINAEEIHN